LYAIISEMPAGVRKPKRPPLAPFFNDISGLYSRAISLDCTARAFVGLFEMRKIQCVFENSNLSLVTCNRHLFPKMVLWCPFGSLSKKSLMALSSLSSWDPIKR